jgi:hypothetical protein
MCEINDPALIFWPGTDEADRRAAHKKDLPIYHASIDGAGITPCSRCIP